MNTEELPLVVRVLREDLANKITAQSAAVAARNAERAGVKAPKWRSLLATPATPEILQPVTDSLAEIAYVNIDKSNAHDAAHIAKSLYAMADYFAEQASLWATDLASDYGPTLSDDEIKKLTESCDEVFQFIFRQTELFERKNDPAIEQELVQLIGQPILAKKMSDGTVKYQLDIERIRTPRIPEAGRKMVLEVNGHSFNDCNFAQAVDTAFSLKTSTFLDLLKSHPTNVFNTEGKPMNFEHDSKVYTVKITTTQS